MRPLEYMESLGWTGRDVRYAHGIHFNDEDKDGDKWERQDFKSGRYRLNRSGQSRRSIHD